MEEQQSLDAGTNVSLENEELATEGTYSDEVETTQEVETIEEEDVEEVAEPEKPKVSKGVKKLLAKKNDLEQQVQTLLEENAIAKLEKQHGDFDSQQVLEIKRQHPTLTYEQAFWLRKINQPQQEREPRRFNSIVWTEARNLESRTITNEQLAKLPQAEYNVAVEKIKKGELAVKG